MKASDQPDEDRRLILKKQIVLCLLGATDGHAKNFNIFLIPGGGFRLTPLYDVMSAQPNVDAHQIERKQFRLAMPVGDSRRSILDTVMPRHFVHSAGRAGMPAATVAQILREIRENAPTSINSVVQQLPSDFPDDMSGPVSVGSTDA